MQRYNDYIIYPNKRSNYAFLLSIFGQNLVFYLYIYYVFCIFAVFYDIKQ